MGGLKNYDDLAGLEYIGEGLLDGFLDMGVLKEVGLAGVSGAAAVLLTTVGSQKLAGLDYFKAMTPAGRARVMSGLAVVVGVGVSRALYDHNRDAAIGVAGGVVGLGLANLIGTFFTTNPLGAPLGTLPEDYALADDGQLLSDYDYASMNGLAEVGVQASAPAFRGLSGPTVSAEALQGAVVQQETLGYQPYLS